VMNHKRLWIKKTSEDSAKIRVDCEMPSKHSSGA